MIKVFTFVIIAVWGVSGQVLAKDYQIDARLNCVSLNKTDSVQKKAVKIKLQLNTAYQIGLSGEGFFSTQTGSEADPMPGVVLFYATNEQDGFASIYKVIKVGEVIRFRTPKEEPQSVFLLAFVMDYWPGSRNMGKFTLTVEEE